MNIRLTLIETRLPQRRRYWWIALLFGLAILSSRAVSLGQRANGGFAERTAKPDTVLATPGLSADPRSASPNAKPTGPGEQPQKHENTHADPVAPVLLGIVIIILAARLGGHFFELAGQPSVLGELIVGVALGNLSLLGISHLDFLKVDWTQQNVLVLHNVLHCAGVTIDHLARIGVILLLFQVGLETSVTEMRRVGTSALLVAVLGVVTPMGLGWGAGVLLLPEHHWAVHLFLGATLAATSVGITARVLKDLGKSTSKEAQIILGAAVIDDVLGLVVLAAAQGIISAISATANGTASEFGLAELAIILVKAIGLQLRIGQERIVDPHTYSALIVMVIITTMITPPLLKWSLKKENPDCLDDA